MWHLLSSTKRICWRMWVFSTLVILSLTFAQTLSGQLAGMLTLAWAWATALLLPGGLMLFGTALTDRSSHRMVPRIAHRSLIGATALYLSLVLCTALAEPLATQANRSMQAYRQESFYWLLLPQLVLLGGFYLLFYKKRPFFQPSTQELRQAAEAQSGIGEGTRQNCLQQIADGKLNKALVTWHAQIKRTGTGDLEKAVLLQRQYKDCQKQYQMNLISYEEWERKQNRISAALMEML